METLELTDSQWCDVLHSLRATAEADFARVVELKARGLPSLVRPFETQAARLVALADAIEAGAPEHGSDCATLDCAYDPRPCDCGVA